MLQDVSLWVPILFILTTLVTVWVFLRANYRPIHLWILLGWALFQAVLSLAGFYWELSTVPPRLLLILLPVVILICWMLLSPAGKRISDRYDLRLLTLIHTIRLPVEIVLYGLFLGGAIPELMTFTGKNPDIIMGITAPLVYLLCFRLWANHPERARRFLIFWHVSGILLLSNIVFRALLSVPTPFQQWGFEQPNVAVTYFPYVWLPALVVPIVFFSHFASIRLLLKR